MMTKIIKISVVLFLAISAMSFSVLKNKKTSSEVEGPNAIKVEITGKGNPVLFLPGFTCPGSVWEETIQKMTTERQSHLVSYAGFNGLEPIDMPWYDNIKKATIEYIKDHKLKNIMIVGHSMGGTLAIDIAAALPKKVSKIALIEALPCMREVMMPGMPAEALFYESPYNKQMLEMNDEQFMGMASMMSSNMTTNADKVETLTNWVLAADRKTYVYGYTDLLKLDLRPILGDLKCETLIIGASLPDAEMFKKNYEDQYSNLSNKEIIIAPDSKHFVMFDQPNWFNKTLNDFLDNE